MGQARREQREQREWEVRCADCLDVLRELPDNSVDAWGSDPPAGVGLMGKEWDKFGQTRGMRAETIKAQQATQKERYGRVMPFASSGVAAIPAQGTREAFVEFIETIAREMFRVMKPGAHGVIWCLPRTAHWTKWALENAGFFIRDDIAHLFGQGFPKSHNISKAIQKAQGVQPVGEKPPSLGMANNPQWNALKRQLMMPEPEGDAARWEGWGTALKPGREDWALIQKPIEGTYAANVLKWGTGALNIDACKIGEAGRWPANVVLGDGAPEALERASSFFFYCAKPSRKEREAGCEHLQAKTATSGKQPRKNTHPTVKPIKLMRWLLRLITPPGGLVVDTFAGSGTTGCAARLEGFRFLGIEMNEEHCRIARARIAHWDAQ